MVEDIKILDEIYPREVENGPSKEDLEDKFEFKISMRRK